MATIPSGRLVMDPRETALAAPRHGGLSHCMHWVGMKKRLTLGYSPLCVSGTVRYVTPGGSAFSVTQATLQALQPTHFLWSITMTHRLSSTGFLNALCRSRCIRR